MALIKCHECGKKVSTESAACPNCGAAVRPPPPSVKKSWSKILRNIGFIFLALMFAGAIVNVLEKMLLTPEQLKQREEAQKVAQERKAEDEKRKAVDFKRVRAASVAAQSILQSARNPDSVQWMGILANEDASIICFKLRAQNGFGGMTVEHIPVINGQFKSSDAAWNKNCVNKDMYDVKDGVIRLLKIHN